MPTAKELVGNRPLAGTDLAKIMLKDFEDMLAQDGYLTGHIAYGRVAYELRYVLHADNAAAPTLSNVRRSRPVASNVISIEPKLAALSGDLPLPDADRSTSVVADRERHRDIDSPNAARIEHGLPVTVVTRDQSGHHIEHNVTYPPDMIEGETPDPIDTSRSRETRAAWGLEKTEPTPPPIDDTVYCDCVPSVPDENQLCGVCGNEVLPK